MMKAHVHTKPLNIGHHDLWGWAHKCNGPPHKSTNAFPSDHSLFIPRGDQIPQYDELDKNRHLSFVFIYVIQEHIL